MTINNRLAILLAEKCTQEKRNISIAEVAGATEIAPRTLQAWYSNKITRYDNFVIDSLCKYFNCRPGDLIVMQE